MNYTKPEVAVLGEAVSVIELITGTKGPFTPFDAGVQIGPNPAYDLDE